MLNMTLNRLQSRMVREINRCTSTLDMGNLIYVALKREQINQRYLKLMREARQRK